MDRMDRVSTTSERLIQAMTDAEMQQTDLVAATGINKSAISRYVAGKFEPKAPAINKLAQALGVSEMWLWGYDVPKGRSDTQIKNDLLVQAISKMRSDSDFADMVLQLCKIDMEQRDIIKRLLATFINNKPEDKVKKG